MINLRLWRFLGAVVLSLVLAPRLVTGQPSAGPPNFEVASIKRAADVPDTFGGRLGFMRPVMGATDQPGTIPMPNPTRVAIRHMTLLRIVAAAYRLPPTQVSGPGWMDEEPFDVDAKVPLGTPESQVNEMLQFLLQKRFGLVVHREPKNLPGYALLIGKGGPRLTSAPRFEPPSGQDAAEAAAKLRAKLASRVGRAGDDPPPLGVNRYGFSGVDAGQIARILSRLTQGPVVDMTGLKGTYDITLDVSLEEGRAVVGSVLDAVEKLGLRLKGKRVPTDILVVDKVSRIPTPN